MMAIDLGCASRVVGVECYDVSVGGEDFMDPGFLAGENSAGFHSVSSYLLSPRLWLYMLLNMEENMEEIKKTVTGFAVTIGSNNWTLYVTSK
jgi:hypothetical protein